MKFLDKEILDVLVPVEINGKEEFIIGSPNISNEQVQEYLDRLNEYYETKIYEIYENIDEETGNITGEFIPKKDEKIIYCPVRIRSGVAYSRLRKIRFMAGRQNAW